MFSLTRYTTPCPEPINAQILQMVVDNLTDISSVALPPSNLLYNIYQYAIGFEVHLYLEALNGAKGIAVELVVAMEEEKLIGFCLYLPVKDDPEACGIAFMAVQVGHRRQVVGGVVGQGADQFGQHRQDDAIAQHVEQDRDQHADEGQLGLRVHGHARDRCLLESGAQLTQADHATQATRARR